jgi:hypothetical protein
VPAITESTLGQARFFLKRPCRAMPGVAERSSALGRNSLIDPGA